MKADTSIHAYQTQVTQEIGKNQNYCYITCIECSLNLYPTFCSKEMPVFICKLHYINNLISWISIKCITWQEKNTGKHYLLVVSHRTFENRYYSKTKHINFMLTLFITLQLDSTGLLHHFVYVLWVDLVTFFKIQFTQQIPVATVRG